MTTRKKFAALLKGEAVGNGVDEYRFNDEGEIVDVEGDIVDVIFYLDSLDTLEIIE